MSQSPPHHSVRAAVLLMFLGSCFVGFGVSLYKVVEDLKTGRVNWLREASYREGYRQGYLDSECDQPQRIDQ